MLLSIRSDLKSTAGYSVPAAISSRSGKSEHLYTPETIHLLQEAARTGNYETYKKYSECLNREDNTLTLRSLLGFKYDENGGIPIDEVESVESIVPPFQDGRYVIRFYFAGGS